MKNHGLVHLSRLIIPTRAPRNTNWPEFHTGPPEKEVTLIHVHELVVHQLSHPNGALA